MLCAESGSSEAGRTRTIDSGRASSATGTARPCSLVVETVPTGDTYRDVRPSWEPGRTSAAVSSTPPGRWSMKTRAMVTAPEPRMPRCRAGRPTRVYHRNEDVVVLVRERGVAQAPQKLGACQERRPSLGRDREHLLEPRADIGAWTSGPSIHQPSTMTTGTPWRSQQRDGGAEQLGEAVVRARRPIAMFLVGRPRYSARTTATATTSTRGTRSPCGR
jgi:hypothetical protein